MYLSILGLLISMFYQFKTWSKVWKKINRLAYLNLNVNGICSGLAFLTKRFHTLYCVFISKHQGMQSHKKSFIIFYYSFLKLFLEDINQTHNPKELFKLGSYYFFYLKTESRHPTLSEHSEWWAKMGNISLLKPLKQEKSKIECEV